MTQPVGCTIWAAVAAQIADRKRSSAWIYALIYSSNQAMPNAHHSFEILSKHMKAHPAIYPRQGVGQEVGASYSVF